MKTIAFYSTNNKSERANFETALMNGLASHYGLYMMKRNDIPRLSPETLKAMKGKSYARIAFEVLNPFSGRRGWRKKSCKPCWRMPMTTALSPPPCST